MRNMNYFHTVTAVKDQALGNSANTGWEATIPLDRTGGDVTLFLANSGLSTTLTVTFQIGFYADGARPSSYLSSGAVDTGTITWVTPPKVTGTSTTAGTVDDMTTVDCNGSACSARVVLPKAPFVHFKITENANNTANNVSLYLCHN